MSETEDERNAVVDDEQRVAAEGAQSSVWQRLSLKQLRWTALALILVATAAFGGLKTAHHSTLISLGQSYTAGALTVTPRSVSLVDRWTGLPRLAPQCRYLVLKVTIQNTAHESVPYPLTGPLAGRPSDCAPPHPRADTEAFGLTGVANQFAATFRGKETITVPTISAGFTYDYSVLWAVSKADLAHRPVISIRFYRMYSFISTLVLSRRWGGDYDRFGELRISNVESA
ncbi:hypothetical protein PT015_23110 [Candidatus Mycobacterium wuenschmannii]|uniref:DUF4352 domain-containing protein n=1 Tax=Candidatus Mycobacterium wuenschmannii TaxID=3027808 RepID=A0ABY8W1L7_9MYCO|nr:hypothetical protein [Candidatus Mycobacterium wuenschmannii]WIM87684.1 hypothetical protein PT015_23110 [Candidatus Mycobacterium wuenschmannii]